MKRGKAQHHMMHLELKPGARAGGGRRQEAAGGVPELKPGARKGRQQAGGGVPELKPGRGGRKVAGSGSASGRDAPSRALVHSRQESLAALARRAAAAAAAAVLATAAAAALARARSGGCSGCVARSCQRGDGSGSARSCQKGWVAARSLRAQGQLRWGRCTLVPQGRRQRRRSLSPEGAAAEAAVLTL